MTTVERRYRWFMRFYPKAYREERSEEIVAALLEGVASEKAWPSPPEVRGILMGGLRMRGRLTADGVLHGPDRTRDQ